jgi:hypothetical protein
LIKQKKLKCSKEAAARLENNGRDYCYSQSRQEVAEVEKAVSKDRD